MYLGGRTGARICAANLPQRIRQYALVQETVGPNGERIPAASGSLISGNGRTPWWATIASDRTSSETVDHEHHGHSEEEDRDRTGPGPDIGAEAGSACEGYRREPRGAGGD